MMSIIIRYNRRSVCMGDDVQNGIYKIEMLSDAKLSVLGIKWVFAEREGKTPDLAMISRRFE